MKNLDISFIILTYNEEQHLQRLLDSIKSLEASTYILDSHSTDKTLEICAENGAFVAHHAFHNHPKQWDYALNIFPISTPWVICLDADQIVSTELLDLLQQFKDKDYLSVEGIYFNRKNYFKGRWIKHGGYYPKYLLKMFRYGHGWSDLNENMDHRFLVTGKTQIWSSGHIIEENLKENHIAFWITKHNRYSDLLAEEEFYRKRHTPPSNIRPSLFGAPNSRKLWLKNFWLRLPLYFRPILYLIYRLIIRKGVLDGKTGITFHFLQGFWFRLIVDIKIDELQNRSRYPNPYNFLIRFISLLVLFYGFHIAFIGLSTPGGYYYAYLDHEANYIGAWRERSIELCAFILRQFGHQVFTTATSLSVQNHSGFRLIYSCLGYGVISTFAAFVIAFPKPSHTKYLFLFFGIIFIQFLNILRLISVALFFNPSNPINHHLLYNTFTYFAISLLTLTWAKKLN